MSRVVTAKEPDWRRINFSPGMRSADSCILLPRSKPTPSERKAELEFRKIAQHLIKAVKIVAGRVDPENIPDSVKFAKIACLIGDAIDTMRQTTHGLSLLHDQMVKAQKRRRLGTAIFRRQKSQAKV